VAYTGNNMRKASPSPDPKDKNKEVFYDNSVPRAKKKCCPVFQDEQIFPMSQASWLPSY